MLSLFSYTYWVQVVSKVFRFYYSIMSLVKRDLKLRYAGSFLGMVWVVINPLIQLLIYSFVFGIVLRVRLGPQFVGVNYTSWLLAGLLPWLYFADSVSRSPMAVVDQKQLVKKTTFPSEFFTIVQNMSGLVQHLITMLLLIAYLLIVHPIRLPLLWQLILPLGLQLMMMAGLGWVFAAINVFVRDVQQIVLVIINLMFYLTPIIYPPTAIPNKYQALMHMNPLYFIVESYRTIVLTGQIDYTGIVSSALFAGLVLVLGAATFSRLKGGFADVI